MEEKKEKLKKNIVAVELIENLYNKKFNEEKWWNE